MPGKVTLEITQGVMRGKRFEFTEHDVFLFGRADDCHARLPDDPLVSRHHFLLEVHPPNARLRDLGSLNGTYVNDTRYGGRDEGETPEQAAARRYPEINLKAGDRIEVGDTLFTLQVEVPVFCGECGRDLTREVHEPHPSARGAFICTACKSKLAGAPRRPERPAVVRCQVCGKDVSQEADAAAGGARLCRACRDKADTDPIEVLREFLAGRSGAAPKRQAGPGEVAAGGRALPEIPGYDTKEELGHGGMGIVYLAQRAADRKLVALKMMLARVAVNEHSRQVFQREIEVTRTLRHPNIVEFIEQGSVGDLFYFVMEFYELEQLLKMEFCKPEFRERKSGEMNSHNPGGVDKLMSMSRDGGRLPLPIASAIMVQALEGLAHAHKQGFVHRDLKPPNILLCGSDARPTAKVSDFGLAKSFDQAGLSGMTVTGAVAGTAAFMPREQYVDFKRFRPAGDVWSMGATYYHMLTGTLPRSPRPRQDPIDAVLHNPVIPIRESAPARRNEVRIGDNVAKVIDRSLQVDVKTRYQDAGEMLEALKQALARDAVQMAIPGR